jgi:hypothetical protein
MPKAAEREAILKPTALYVHILPLGQDRRLFEKHFFQRAQMAFVEHNQDCEKSTFVRAELTVFFKFFGILGRV